MCTEYVPSKFKCRIRGRFLDHYYIYIYGVLGVDAMCMQVNK